MVQFFLFIMKTKVSTTEGVKVSVQHCFPFWLSLSLFDFFPIPPSHWSHVSLCLFLNWLEATMDTITTSLFFSQMRRRKWFRNGFPVLPIEDKASLSSIHLLPDWAFPLKYQWKRSQIGQVQKVFQNGNCYQQHRIHSAQNASPQIWTVFAFINFS